MRSNTAIGSREAGFTLTELMAVVFIILLLTVLALPVVLGAVRDRKLGDGTRAIQGIISGARDRAIASGRVCGVRFLRDELDPWECSRLVYVAAPDPYSVGVVAVAGTVVTPLLTLPGGVASPDPHFEQVDPGKDNRLGGANQFDDIPRVVGGRSYIRFNHSGAFILVASVNASASPATLTLAFPASISGGPHQYQLFGPPGPMAQEGTNTVQALPDGIVIDLRGSPIISTNPLSGAADVNVPRSRNLPFQIPPDGPGLRGPNGTYGDSDDPSPQTWMPIEILFGPNGSVVGPAATSAMIHLWLGERADKGPDAATSNGPDNMPGTADDTGPNRPRSLITLNTRSGSIEVYQNPGTAGTAARTFSEIYIPAEQTMGVSRVP